MKPKLIIADGDYKFIVPLQVKFVEAFFGEIELEIITDKEIFSERFHGTKKASENPDVLLVQEEWMEDSLLSSGIKHICVFTTDQKKEDVKRGAVEYFFRFNSVTEIFNKIKGYIPRVSSDNPTRVIVVCSAKGGVGKTTLAVGISAYFVEKFHYKVLYLNAAHLASFQRLLSDRSSLSPKESVKFAVDGELDFKVIKPILRQEGFFYLPPFKASLSALGLNYSVYAKIVRAAKSAKAYDFIVVDADCVMDAYGMELVKEADKVLVVTDQTDSAIFATNLLGNSIAGTETEKYLFVCNNFQKDLKPSPTSPKYNIEEIIEHLSNYDALRCGDLAKCKGIQKTTLLLE